MNSKTLLTNLIILTIFVYSVQGLTMNKIHKKSQNLKTQAPKNSHKIATYFHLNAEDPHIPQDLIDDFDQFVKGDEQLNACLRDSSPLSPQGAQKIKNYLINSSDFNNVVLNALNQDPLAPGCFKEDLTENQKRKYINILLEQKDLTNFFVEHDYSLHRSPDETSKAKDAIYNDSDLGPSVFECVEFYIHSSKII